MKIKSIIFSVCFFVILNSITVSALVIDGSSIGVYPSSEQHYMEQGYSQEDVYYAAGVYFMSDRNRGDKYVNFGRIFKDFEDLGAWKDVAWYYFVDWNELQKFVLNRKLSAGLITNEEYMAEINKEKIEAEKEKRRIFLYVGSNKAIVNDNEKVIDEENPETVVFVENDRSYLPVRFLCEEYGGTVDWIEETQTVNIHIKEHEISLTIGNTVIIVDGEIVENDVAPVLRNGRTFLPLRALVDAIGKYVIYNSGLIVIDDNQDMVWEMKNMEFVEGFSRERFGMFNAN